MSNLNKTFSVVGLHNEYFDHLEKELGRKKTSAKGEIPRMYAP